MYNKLCMQVAFLYFYGYVYRKFRNWIYCGSSVQDLNLSKLFDENRVKINGCTLPSHFVRNGSGKWDWEGHRTPTGT